MDTIDLLFALALSWFVVWCIVEGFKIGRRF